MNVNVCRCVLLQYLFRSVTTSSLRTGQPESEPKFFNPLKPVYVRPLLECQHSILENFVSHEN